MQSKVDLAYEPLIEASGLAKQFGSVQALMNLNLRVMPGEIYGLLGRMVRERLRLLKLFSVC